MRPQLREQIIAELIERSSVEEVLDDIHTVLASKTLHAQTVVDRLRREDPSRAHTANDLFREPYYRYAYWETVTLYLETVRDAIKRETQESAGRLTGGLKSLLAFSNSSG